MFHNLYTFFQSFLTFWVFKTCDERRFFQISFKYSASFINYGCYITFKSFIHSPMTAFSGYFLKFNAPFAFTRPYWVNYCNLMRSILYMKNKPYHLGSMNMPFFWTLWPLYMSSDRSKINWIQTDSEKALSVNNIAMVYTWWPDPCLFFPFIQTKKIILVLVFHKCFTF